MGDGFDVVSCRHRMENSSLREAVDLRHLAKDFEREIERVKHSKDLKSPSSEPDDTLQRHSGEPDRESTKNILDFGSPENDSMLEMAITEPKVVPFPYADTKLRPEAPPFTPECVSPDPEPALGEGEPDVDSSCFVNVDLKIPARGEGVFPEVEPAPPTTKHQQDAKENKDVGLQKPFGLAFPTHCQLKKPAPADGIETPELALDEEDSIVAVEPTTSAASETRRAVRGDRVNILSPAFFLGNKTQIIVLLASIVVCVILVIFVLV